MVIMKIFNTSSLNMYGKDGSFCLYIIAFKPKLLEPRKITADRNGFKGKLKKLCSSTETLKWSEVHMHLD